MIGSKEFKKYYSHPNLKLLHEKIMEGKKQVFLKGLSGSSSGLFSSRFFVQFQSPMLFILDDKEAAAYFYNDLRNLLNDKILFFFPSSYKRSVQYQQTDGSNIILRTEVLNILTGRVKNIIIVTYPEAIIEMVLTRQALKKNTLHLKKNEKISIPFIEELLDEYQFERADFVYEPGQYSVRGSIVDIFSFSNDFPFRLDFFGNEVESIRTFNIESQLSLESCNKISILPNIKDLTTEGSTNSLFKILNESFLLWIYDVSFTRNRINELYKNTTFEIVENEVMSEVMKKNKETLLITGDQFINDIREFVLVEFGRMKYYKNPEVISFHTSPQPVFNKNFELLATNFLENINKGYKNYLLTDNEKQFNRLESIFSDIQQEVKFIPVRTTLHEGFIDHNLKICCYTDHQIFERFHKFQLKSDFSKKEALTLRELTSLHPGDYVVHIDQGIGRFGGLEKIEVNGRLQEAIKLVYKDNDTLYVSIHALHRISKYKGRYGDPPKIHKLGSAAWQNLKQKTKRKVKDIAKELIKLYAQRKAQKGFSFSPDTYLQTELEASFIYEDTPDQLSASNAVKQGMEASFPIDHLVCGDVGFGKTEIAIRAAFKAVADSKQVALLVPTTILALQHYNTFRSRLKDFPCNIDSISRFKKPAEQKTILKDLSMGKIDIIIGTHRLVSKDIRFKNLGLLIIDEEQKFGVSVKEKIRQIKISVDTLTLTATPIPRTLQFSLMGARDLSIIRTPPPNRHPIITELHQFNEELIKEGIEYEVSRGGQVFFIHNRIINIEEIKKTIDRLVPKVKSVIAHGQMESKKLEAIMLDFINGYYDVLVATTIVESGLDIPNANTIFINNAHQFGLSDLHQLRGRVGRSNKKAFCYLIAPQLNFVSGEARLRLKAIEEFSEIGSGFNIAMQDLDIRGAGNLLGAEQSGFIADIGFETYQQILQEAIQELKEDEFREQFNEHPDEKQVDPSKIVTYVNDVYIDTDQELLFPDEYIANISERLRLYRKLDDLETEKDLLDFSRQLEDRFGPVPSPSQELMNVVRLRNIAKKLGFQKIVLKRQTLIMHFVSNRNSAYYNSPVFSRILTSIQKQHQLYRIREIRGKLTLTVPDVKNIAKALEILTTIL